MSDPLIFVMPFAVVLATLFVVYVDLLIKFLRIAIKRRRKLERALKNVKIIIRKKEVK